MRTKKTMYRGLGSVMLAASVLTAGCSGASSSDNADTYPSEPVTFTVPSDPGGGWDTTVRALVESAEKSDLTNSALPVQNRTGSAGCVWRTQMINGLSGNAYNISMDSTPVIAGFLRGECENSWQDVTLLSTVATERYAVVTAANSEYQSLDDLLAAIAANPEGVPIAASGDDKLPLALLVAAKGGDPSRINFVQYDGGGQQVTALLNGDVAASVAGVSEFRGQIEADALRGLVVISEESLSGTLADIPTSVSLGIDVTYANTRVVYGPPDMPDYAVAYWEKKIPEILETDQWKELAERNQWDTLVLVGDEADQYFTDAQQDIKQALIDTDAISG
ncbi:C4-dicarboxylate ABC transporter substrate-binding protein [Mycolicibacterium murale]|uniref:C4-dicarboxylate ABC transporter substrate-binding protein n=1 Tax=Mycolicibacterium murale TaxID=182220 RepID=A0A7I9WFM2_9MYCO|nr:tripartite tricarboxylate transporter substrate-binding protein [Mycolicibacterium murale]MCV7182240.1 tripartite tricarboxylate transporter substrate binding protein [Mycolicibacterium murale]GFG56066.1 C4-dicarboxylate ABC transporter substrate-binding protein [Mycolicibacterium murale]